MVDDGSRSCQACGASIYTEHLDTGIAGYFGGKLLCPHCLEEAEANEDVTSSSGSSAADDLEVISLVDDDPAPAAAARSKGETQIRSFGSESQVGATYDEAGLERAVNPNSPAATRCRTFHAKLNEGAVAFMNRQVNEWTDANPAVTIKFATSTIGIFEGKKQDPHLILTVFY
jgi:hypothetical protein